MISQEKKTPVQVTDLLHPIVSYVALFVTGA